MTLHQTSCLSAIIPIICCPCGAMILTILSIVARISVLKSHVGIIPVPSPLVFSSGASVESWAVSGPLYCIVLHCIVLFISPGTDSSLSRQSSLIFLPVLLTVTCQTITHCTSRAMRKSVNNWTWKKPIWKKTRFEFSEDRGRWLEKTPPENFFIREGEDTMKSVSRTRDKNTFSWINRFK